MKNQVKLLDPIADQKALETTMKAIEKIAHGGVRPGAGRKSKGINAHCTTMTISGTQAEIEKIRQLANESGKTNSRFLIELALGENHPTSEQWKQIKKVTKN